jgi:hypothetical protein
MAHSKCCAEKIRKIYLEFGTDILHYETTCDTCNHYIGLTYTPIEEINKFLESFKLEQINNESNG